MLEFLFLITLQAFRFGKKLESAGGNPILKKLAVSKLIELKERVP